MKISIYVEGGGDGKSLKIKCREGFRAFFERAGFKGKMPVVIACGGRTAAHDKFCTAMKQVKANELPLLLIDSEGPLPDSELRWTYLKRQANLDTPSGAAEDHAHFMVQLMESWFLADREVLASFFGQGFTEGSLPSERNIENIPKERVTSSLANATRNSRKGQYGKSQHSFELLAQIDPEKVRAASPVHAERLLTTLEDKLG